MALAVSQPAVSTAAEHLILGEHEQTEVIVELPPGSRDLQVSASVGQVVELQQLEGQRYQGRYLPPDEFFPQPAIIAAVAQRQGQPIYCWTVLPLWGQGEAILRARPQSKVAVQVGKQTFGPIIADAQGVARVPLVVPPGVEHALRGRQKVALNLPPAQRLHLVATPDHVPGVEPRSVTALLFSVDAAGQPASGGAPRLAAFGAEVPLAPLAEGVWQGQVAIPVGKPASFTLAAQLAQDPEQTSQAAIKREPGPPSQLIIRAPGRVGAVPETIQLAVSDSLGTPVDGEPQAQADQGRLGPLVRVEQGRYEALWRPPLQPTAARATITARLEDKSAAQESVWLSHYRPPQKWWASATALWVGVVSTAALLGAGLTTRGLALQQSSEYKDSSTSIARRQELKDSGEALTLTSNITLGLAAAAAATTAVLYLLGRQQGAEQRQQARSVQSAPGLSWSF